MLNCFLLQVDMDDKDGVDNISKIQTMIDEEDAATWATQNKNTQEAVEKLFNEGFRLTERYRLPGDKFVHL